MDDVSALESSCPSEEGPSLLDDRNLQEVVELLAERDKEIVKLLDQQQEILRINHHWEAEYKELKRNCELLRSDLKNAQEENNALIARLKREKQQHNLQEQMKQFKTEKEHLEKKYNELKAKYENQKRHYTEVISQLRRTSPPPEGQVPPVSTCKSQHNKKITEYQEKIMLLNTQLHAYKEDFEAEKRDKDRLKSEKSTEKLRLEAEIASLKIQLDRSNSDLSQYKSEAIRLFHQLRLKQHREDEEYRRHLEKQGYSSSKPLPPLDPFVEKDVYYGYKRQLANSSPVPLSSSYQTYMNETSQTYHPRPQRRVSMPSYRTYDTSFNKEPEYFTKDVTRSVSPQIHRLGNLRLYSRESDQDLLSHGGINGDSNGIDGDIIGTSADTNGTQFDIDSPKSESEICNKFTTSNNTIQLT